MQPVTSVGALQPSYLPAVSFVLNFTSHANRCQIWGENAPKPGVLAWGLLWPRVCQSPSVSRADMSGSTLLTVENICTEHLETLGCITHTSGTAMWCVCHRVPTAGHWFSARRTWLPLRTIGNVCRFCGCHGVGVVYWHLVGTGLDAAINTLRHRTIPQPGPEVSSAR